MMFRALTLNRPAGMNCTPNRGEQSVCGGVKFLQRLLFVGLVLAISLTAVLSAPEDGAAAETQNTAPFISIGMDQAQEPGKIAVVLQIFLLMTILSLAPAILIMLTSFTRVVIVLSLLRRALGTMQMPPNQVLIGLSLFLTFFIMTPVWQQINKTALQPYLEDKIEQQQALQKAAEPLRGFMFKQTREKDLALFVNIAKIERPKDVDDIPISVLIPSFIISEVKTAFQIGLLLYVPFLIIDMVVASVLLSMGMMMLPPIMISLPFKLMLFVLADGWNLLVGSLVRSFV
jgi:flagellar biosynthetic protein FliP